MYNPQMETYSPHKDGGAGSGIPIEDLSRSDMVTGIGYAGSLKVSGNSSSLAEVKDPASEPQVPQQVLNAQQRNLDEFLGFTGYNHE
tara:strand:- start:104 stop:364 length:261 start_codon:yes stop_codon:yes gene_type:complete